MCSFLCSSVVLNLFYVLKQFIVTIQLQTARCWASTGIVVICAKKKQKKNKHKTNKTKYNPSFSEPKMGGEKPT